jgi:hypothetical protein
MSDEEVGLRVQSKYPEQYKDFYPLQVVELYNYYDPNIGRLRSWWRRWKSEGRGKLHESLNNELRLILEKGAMLQDAALSSQQKFQTFVAQNHHLLLELRYKESLFEQAAAKGMTVETLQVTKLEEELSRIRITEFKEREAIQLNNELKRMQEQVRLALIAKALSSHQRLMLVQELLDGLYRQIEDLDHSGLKPETRKRMIEDREAIIRIFKAYRDAEGSRLLQTD